MVALKHLSEWWWNQTILSRWTSICMCIS